MSKEVTDFSCAFELKKSDDGDDGCTFEGIASTPDTDSHNDIVEVGAFEPIATKMSPHGELVPNVMMLRDHDPHHIIGGWRSIQQRGNRLYVQGDLAMEVEKARETYALMKKGYLTGLSVGFMVKDKADLVYNQRNGKRHIKKATLKECSIVGFPANSSAKIITVKSDVEDWLVERGFDVSDLEHLLQLAHEAKDAQKPYGDVEYADPGYQEDGKKRYPINNEGRIRAAWNYINKPSNQKFYSREEVKRVMARIIRAWKRVIDKDGPPAYQEGKGEEEVLINGLIKGIDDFKPIDPDQAMAELDKLFSQMKGRGYV